MVPSVPRFFRNAVPDIIPHKGIILRPHHDLIAARKAAQIERIVLGRSRMLRTSRKRVSPDAATVWIAAPDAAPARASPRLSPPPW